MNPNFNTKIPFIGYLLNNSSIPEVMVDAYYRLQPDQPEQLPANYIGRLHRYNAPYQVRTFGGYPLMLEWDLLQHRISLKVYDETVVNEYLKSFGEGFQLGYLNFETDIVKNGNSIFNDELNFAQKIFDFARASDNYGGNFSEVRWTGEHVFSGWKENGVRAGYYYRAWYIMLENHKIFEQFFTKKEGG